MLATVSEEKSTWTKWNVVAETERQLRGRVFPTPADREAATNAVVDRALGVDLAVTLTDAEAQALSVDASPAALAIDQTRSNGESVYVQHGAARYTVQELLDAEQRLLDLATQPTRYGLDPQTTADLLADFEQRYDVTLDDGQRGLVLGFAADPRRLVLGIGPAGAGKTTAMRAVAHAWQKSGRRLVALAPSAAAAEVLGAELGCRADNLHKFQHAHETGTADDEGFVLQPGDLVLVDEAGMAGTRRLDWLTRYARERGALVRLLGDPAQMSPVEAGGAFHLLHHDVGAYELTELHRFTDPDEAAATLQLRNADTSAIDFYETHDRLTSGSRDAMLEQAYDAWAREVSQGSTSLLIAASSRDVSALNKQARRSRVQTGDVEERGVPLRDGNLAGAGDLVITRLNDRRLPVSGSGFVKNGDRWQVLGRGADGDLQVRHLDTGGTTTLPADYVSSSVELGYAVTASGAQGMTVDSAHVIVDDRTSREGLYVAVTRGRASNNLYLVTEEQLTLDADRPPAEALDARELLTSVIRREAAERSATEVRRANAAPTPRQTPNRRASITPDRRPTPPRPTYGLRR